MLCKHLSDQERNVALKQKREPEDVGLKTRDKHEREPGVGQCKTDMIEIFVDNKY